MNTLYVGSDDTVVLTCPGCDKAKTIDVSSRLGTAGPIELTYRFHCDTCACGHATCQDCLREHCTLGHVNTVRLERRKNVRREVSLAGTLLLGGADSLKVKILDISRQGVRIEYSSHFHLDRGRRGIIEFQLNDRNNTRIRKEAQVGRIAGNAAVLMFLEGNAYSAVDKAIGFFLMNTTGKNT